MKIVIETEKCVAAGQCVLSAPDVFDQYEEDGTVILLTENPSSELTDDVEEAAALCPGRAIRLEK
jgi:ferredoxin